MEHLDESQIFIFLIQLLVLLGLARGLGELFNRFGQPAITAEILIGVMLGPTLLGRLWPEGFAFLFPATASQWNMLDTVAWFGILFFLLKIGIEMDMSSAWRQRGDALIISLADVVIPMIIAFVPCLFLAQRYMGASGGPILFALFIATVSTISALPMTARVLQDLRLYRTDLGFLIMCALSMNDILGWIIFTLILGFMTQAGLSLSAVATVLFSTLVFTAVCLTAGRSVCNRGLLWMQHKRLPEPGSSLTFVCLLGFVCGAITLKIGIHALFGFFLAGMMVGECTALSEKTRNVIAQMVHAIFIPLFFATIGLKVDFAASFDWFLATFIFLIGLGGRFAGAWLGTRMTRQSPANRLLISIAHTPGGEMQIVVGMLAMNYGLITEPVFVAIVFSAVGSSVLLGPWMKYALKTRKEVRIEEYFIRGGVLASLKATTRDAAIAELCDCAVQQEPSLHLQELTGIVLKRERQMGTAITDGLAVPHGRIPGLAKPMIAFGRSTAGIEWNAPDGAAARFIYLALTPAEDPDTQLHILRSIALAMNDAELRKTLAEANDDRQLWDALHHALMKKIIPRKK